MYCELTIKIRLMFVSRIACTITFIESNENVIRDNVKPGEPNEDKIAS